MRLNLSEPLSVLVNARFLSAKATSALIFTPTELITTSHTSTKIPFQVRCCPGLAKKPHTALDAQPKKELDPFDTAEGPLVISKIPASNPTHFLTLNKYPIIKNHFIIATIPFKPQTDDLEVDDLALTYACLREWTEDESKKRLFAFFNSGPHSGASQSHRHIQFLPVEDIDSEPEQNGWRLLIDDLDNQKPLPLKAFARDIPEAVSDAQLHSIYLDLLGLCRSAWQEMNGTGDTSQFSYNIGLTLSRIVLVPRTHEGLDRDGGFIAFNGTLLAGTLMVKSSELWHNIQARPSLLDKVLDFVGVPETV